MLTSLGNFLQLEGMTYEQIGALDASVQDLAADFTGTLGTFVTALSSLECVIKEGELCRYDYLKERLNVAVDLLPTADTPPNLQNLIAQAEQCISAHIDFIVRNDVDNDTRRLALQSTSELRRKIKLFLTKGLDLDKGVVCTFDSRQSKYGRSARKRDALVRLPMRREQPGA